MLSKKKCLIYYHGADWNGIPARHRYLMEALSKYVPVIFLDGSAEIRRRVTHCNYSPNITVVRGLISIFVALEHRNLKILNRLCGNFFMRKFTSAYDKVLFWNSENWARPYRYISHDVLIYDCIDPAFTSNHDEIREYDRRDLQVLASASWVFASATSLYDRCAKHHTHVTLLNNACAPEDYNEQAIAAAPKPAWWPATEKSVAAYLGSLDWRFDFEMVTHACTNNPSVHFILAGNILPQFESQVAALRKLGNVTTPGKISVNDGRYLLAHCTIGLIPFIMGEMNDAVNPVKMYAYALMGKPVAATATRETTSHPDIVTTAGTPEGFSMAIREALARARRPETAPALKTFALENTWDARAAVAWKVIDCL